MYCNEFFLMFLDYISAKREKEMFRVFSLKKRKKEMFRVLCQNPIQSVPTEYPRNMRMHLTIKRHFQASQMHSATLRRC